MTFEQVSCACDSGADYCGDCGGEGIKGVQVNCDAFGCRSFSTVRWSERNSLHFCPTHTDTEKEKAKVFALSVRHYLKGKHDWTNYDLKKIEEAIMEMWNAR